MSAARAAFLSIVLSAVSAVALAQPAGPSRVGPPGDEGRWDGAEMRAHAEARHLERAKALHDVLSIRPEQESAFAAFTAAMHPREGDRGREGRDRTADDGLPRAMTTPERLDRMKADMDRRFAAMREAFDRRAAATRTLYAALDPHQRVVMDALPGLSGSHGGMDRDGGMAGRGPMGKGM